MPAEEMRAAPKRDHAEGGGGGEGRDGERGEVEGEETHRVKERDSVGREGERDRQTKGASEQPRKRARRARAHTNTRRMELPHGDVVNWTDLQNPPEQPQHAEVLSRSSRALPFPR